jgi:hypothetical protein
LGRGKILRGNDGSGDLGGAGTLGAGRKGRDKIKNQSANVLPRFDTKSE